MDLSEDEGWREGLNVRTCRPYALSANRNSRQGMRFEPQRASGGGRIDAGFFPPCRFIARAMDLAMVSPTQWNGKLITHLTA